MNSENFINPKKIIWFFIFCHCILWIIAPTLIRYALPHDTIEGYLWGQHLEWGYDKNPWMNAWLTRLGSLIGGSSGVGIYALSSFFVGLCFWSVWELAQKIVSPINAVISVLLLEGCINYSLIPQGFNDNVIELGLWPFMFLCFYNALSSQKIIYWILTGITAGLCLMTKYYSMFPLFIMLLFLIVHQKSRKSFQLPGLYYGIGVCVLIILPHIIWLFQHDFITLKYALNRTDDLGNNTKASPFWKFSIFQIINFILPILICLILKKSSIPMDKNAPINRIGSFNKYFIIWMALGPFLLTILLTGIFHWHLYNEWGVPLVSLCGLLLVMLFKLELNQHQFKKFLVLIFAIMFLWVIIYWAGLILDKKNKHSDNYPAQEIATYVTQQFHHYYHKPLKYAAGSRYVGGYIAFYSSDHPSVLVEWNPIFSPWIPMNQMKKYGAVFVQDNYYGTTVFGQRPDTDNGMKFPVSVLKTYPNLIILPVQYFSWKRGNVSLPKIPVLIGFLPPEENGK